MIIYRFGVGIVTLLTKNQWAPTEPNQDHPSLPLEDRGDTLTLNNYLFVKVGDGMSLGEKIR